MKDAYGKKMGVKINKTSGEKINIGISNEVKPIEMKKMPTEGEYFNTGIGREVPAFEVRNILYLEESKNNPSISIKASIINESVDNQVEKIKAEAKKGYDTIVSQLKQTGCGAYCFSTPLIANIVEKQFIEIGFSKNNITFLDNNRQNICIDIRKEKEYIEAINKIDLYTEVAKELGLTLK